jgi:protein-S-isoprenylcysteine O-methyltransferase Ste14
MDSLFPSVTEAVVFWAVFVAFLASVVSWIARNRQARGERRRDLFLLIFVVAIIAIIVGYARIGPLPHWVFFLGEPLFIAGLLFTLSSYMRLGRNLSPFPEVFADHEIIDTGPYRYIRHPGYLGILIASVGLGLAMRSWVSLLILLAGSIMLLMLRIRLEEQHMAHGLGQRYTEYMARTKRLIPFLW